MIEIYGKDVENTINEYKQKTLKKFFDIETNLQNKLFELEFKNINNFKEAEEITRAMEEINIYIYYIENMTINLFDGMVTIISKLYLITQSIPKTLIILKQMGNDEIISENKKKSRRIKSRLTKSRLTEYKISKFFKEEEEYKYNKAFQFAQEIFNRKSKKGEISDWKSIYLIKELDK
ncbi:hypothetical protein QPD51_18450 [Clostridioides difficile]|nr:hypothetical protein [Clostridioides difficile]MDI3129903.1 hypothetical protein [Clostridioides difficile]MDK3143506.1 hypothetical protein [Clostridioides difficile]